MAVARGKKQYEEREAKKAEEARRERDGGVTLGAGHTTTGSAVLAALARLRSRSRWCASRMRRAAIARERYVPRSSNISFFSHISVRKVVTSVRAASLSSIRRGLYIQ